LDVNGDNAIDYGEIKEMFKGESKMSDVDFINYMKEVDLNGDG